MDNGSRTDNYFIDLGDCKVVFLIRWYSGSPGCAFSNRLIYENGTVFFTLKG